VQMHDHVDWILMFFYWTQPCTFFDNISVLNWPDITLYVVSKEMSTAVWGVDSASHITHFTKYDDQLYTAPWPC
jgi:hypothetical protein